jgi:beta-glucanase (GH16 family)
MASLALSCGVDKEGNGPADLGWELVWADEFDGPAGQKPDPAKWTYDVGGGGWGNQQLEYNTDRTENVSLDGDGHLAIVARQEDYEGSAYTSARIKTQGLFTLAYGRVEARIKLPTGPGIWPAFWMLGDDVDTVSWPQCGEIDVMEYRGQEPEVVHGSLHGPGYSAGGALTQSFSLNDGSRFDEDFHVFSVEWDLGRIAFFVDGQVYQVLTTRQVPGSGEWVYDHPVFLILNVAVGGTFVGDPSDSTMFPQTMLVDYVRVYKRP